jgi:very-short-patch-repair endonuclease
MPSGVYKRTPKTIKAISEAAKKSWQDPERVLRPHEDYVAMGAASSRRGVKGGYTMSVAALLARRLAAARMREVGHTDATKRHLAERAAIRIAEGRHSVQTTAFTLPELAMAKALEDAGVEYEPQHRIGPRVVDFYLPVNRTVIEVDGIYWHPNGPDKERDAYLLASGEVDQVVHITDTQLKEAGLLRRGGSGVQS